MVRGLLGQREVAEIRREIADDIAAWPDPPKPHTAGPPPYVDFDQAVTAGKLVPKTREEGVRRLFRIYTHNQKFRELILSKKMMAPAKAVLETDQLVLVQSMALLKPPGTAEKRFHQDQGVFRLAHDKLGASCVLGWWVALDKVDQDNGAMVFAPSTQSQGIVHHHAPDPGPTAHIYYSVAQCPAPEDTIWVPMEPGDALLFDVAVVHGSHPNRSGRPRRAIQCQYAPADARPTRCPHAEEGDAVPPGLEVSRAIGKVFEEEGMYPDDGPTSWFDCDASVRCTEPQYWSYRKPEAKLP